MTNKKDRNKQTLIPRGENLPNQSMKNEGAYLTAEEMEFAERHPLLNRIINPKQAKAISERNLELIDEHLENRNEAARRAAAAVLDELETELNNHVTKHGARIDAELNDYLNKLASERIATVSVDVAKVVEQIQEGFRKAEKIEITAIKDLELRRLNSELETFYEVQEEFKKKFLEKIRFRAAQSDKNRRLY